VPPGYPVLLDLTGRPVVVVGAGPVAARKIAGLLDAGAAVRCVAPAAVDPVAALAAAGRITLEPRPYEPGDLARAVLAFAATGVPEVDRAVAADAADAGIPVNVAGAPAEGWFTTPAVLRRGDLIVAVATSGRTPGLAGALRRRLAAELGPEWATLVRLLGEVRNRLPPAADTAAWDRLLTVLDDLRDGDEVRARARLDRLLGG
jgi:siroheme synthase-like protein